MTSRSRSLRLPVALGILFFALYVGCGLVFHVQAPRLFHHLDQVFDADIPSRIIDLTRPQGGHEWTRFHPLFVLLLNPIGFVIRGVLRLAGFGTVISARLAAIGLTASAGGLAVSVFCLLLRRLGLRPPLALLWSLVFGLSSSQLVFASFPESFAFSALSLAFLFAQGARPQAPRDRLLLAGVITFGMVVTNLVAAVLVRARWLDARRPRAALRALTVYALLVVAITALLSVVQLGAYPGSASFLQPEPLGWQDRAGFAWPARPGDLAPRTVELAAHLAFFNLAAPRLVVTETGSAGTRVDFPDASIAALRPAGIGHALLWTMVLGAGMAAGLRTRLLREPLVIPLLLWIAFNATLHLVVGASPFLYSSQWTFAVVALAAVASDRFAASTPRFRAGGGLVILLLVTLQAAANGSFLWELLRVFKHR